MTRPQPVPLVEVGAIVTVSEADYCYGTGPLRLRVTEAPTDQAGLEWVTLVGREIWYDRGEPRDGRPRSALVRVAALRARQDRR